MDSRPFRHRLPRPLPLKMHPMCVWRAESRQTAVDVVMTPASFPFPRRPHVLWRSRSGVQRGLLEKKLYTKITSPSSADIARARQYKTLQGRRSGLASSCFTRFFRVACGASWTSPSAAVQRRAFLQLFLSTNIYCMP